MIQEADIRSAAIRLPCRRRKARSNIGQANTPIRGAMAGGDGETSSKVAARENEEPWSGEDIDIQAGRNKPHTSQALRR